MACPISFPPLKRRQGERVAWSPEYRRVVNARKRSSRKVRQLTQERTPIPRVEDILKGISTEEAPDFCAYLSWI